MAAARRKGPGSGKDPAGKLLARGLAGIWQAGNSLAGRVARIFPTWGLARSLLVGGIIAGLGVGAWYYLTFLYLPPGRVAPGVRVGPHQVGGMGISRAMARLEPWLARLEQEPISLVGAGEVFVLKPRQGGLAVDRTRLRKELLAVGRQGSLWRQWFQRYQGRRSTIKVSPPVTREKAKLQRFLDSVNRTVYLEAVEPRVIVRGDGTIRVIPEKPGRRVNLRQGGELLGKLFLREENRRARLPLEKLVPSLTAREIRRLGMKEEVAYFTTFFDLQSPNRVHNIKVAAEALNNVLLLPGQTFSFNETVGPRSTEQDYKEAKIIVNNEFVTGTGGGVCQVSSTLYNAALLANLKIIERLNHSRPVSYLAAGRDATVVYGAVDLKFVNTRATPLLLVTEVRGNSLTTRFIGQTKGEENIQLITREEERVPPGIRELPDPRLPLGETSLEEGSPGLRVTLWRQVWRGNCLVREEKISEDIYKKADNILRVGTGKKMGR